MKRKASTRPKPPIPVVRFWGQHTYYGIDGARIVADSLVEIVGLIPNNAGYTADNHQLLFDRGSKGAKYSRDARIEFHTLRRRARHPVQW
jgi:hypothetical protein